MAHVHYPRQEEASWQTQFRMSVFSANHWLPAAIHPLYTMIRAYFDEV